jgi:hypothetical protein
VADADFAVAFSSAISIAFRIPSTPHQNKLGYWSVVHTAQSGRFATLRTFRPSSRQEKRAWLQGLFDSEGNASLSKIRRYQHSFTRRVSFYSTNKRTLAIARKYLAELGLQTITRAMKASAGHKGTKPVFELVLVAGRQHYARFAALVGSNIARKQRTLVALPRSYTQNIAAACRAAQLKGAAAKNRRRETEVWPRVLREVRAFATRGEKMTMRNCMRIQGYSALLGRHASHRQIVARAMASRTQRTVAQ